MQGMDKEQHDLTNIATDEVGGEEADCNMELDTAGPADGTCLTSSKTAVEPSRAAMSPIASNPDVQIVDINAHAMVCHDISRQ